MGKPLFDFQIACGIVAEAEGRSHGKAVADRLARRTRRLDLL